MPLQRAALRTGRSRGRGDLRRAAGRLRAPADRSRYAPGRRAAPRHRLPDQPRAAPQARVPPDHARRSARLLGARNRADRQRRALSPPGVPQEIAPQFRPPGPRRAPPGPAARRHPARGRRPRSDTRPGDRARPLPHGRRLGAHPCGRRPRPVDRAGGREAEGRAVRAGVQERCGPGVVAAEGPELSVPDRVPPAFPPDHYLNRELSWLEFNARVLEEAADPSNPWLERLKFLAIFSSNLDEFFEIRVAGLQQQVYAGVEPQDYGADGLAPADQLAAIERRVHELVAERKNGSPPRRHFAVVQVPAVLDRVVVVSTHGEGRVRFILLEDIIARHLRELFGGLRVVSHTVFRVTRNTDLTIEEEDAEDLLETIEESLRQRRRSDPVRLEISADADEAFVEMLTEAHDLEARDVYRVPGPIDLTALAGLHRLDGFPALKDEPLVPRVAPPFAQGRDVFDVIRSHGRRRTASRSPRWSSSRHVWTSRTTSPGRAPSSKRASTSCTASWA